MSDATRSDWYDVLDEVTVQGGLASAQVPQAWAQGRATFGGLVAALGIRAMRGLAPDDRRLRSMMVSFVGPLPAGSVDIEARLVRSGRAVTHVQTSLSQDSKPACIIAGCFGSERSSTVRVDPPATEDRADPEARTPLPFIPGVTPAFTRYFDFRWAEGPTPFSGASQSAFAGWCRLRDASGPADEELVAGVADAWPSPAIAMLSAPAPASSVTWSLDFVAPPRGAASQWWYYKTSTDAAANGYARCRSELYDQSGNLVTLGTQLVAVFG